MHPLLEEAVVYCFCEYQLTRIAMCGNCLEKLYYARLYVPKLSFGNKVFKDAVMILCKSSLTSENEEMIPEIIKKHDFNYCANGAYDMLAVFHELFTEDEMLKLEGFLKCEFPSGELVWEEFKGEFELPVAMRFLDMRCPFWRIVEGKPLSLRFCVEAYLIGGNDLPE